jgi:hypothetical protein
LRELYELVTNKNGTETIQLPGKEERRCTVPQDQDKTNRVKILAQHMAKVTPFPDDGGRWKVGFAAPNLSG